MKIGGDLTLKVWPLTIGVKANFRKQYILWKRASIPTKWYPTWGGLVKPFLPIIRGTRQNIKIKFTTLLPDRMTSFSPYAFILAHYQTYYTSLPGWLTFGQIVMPYPLPPISGILYIHKFEICISVSKKYCGLLIQCITNPLDHWSMDQLEETNVQG